MKNYPRMIAKGLVLAGLFGFFGISNATINKEIVGTPNVERNLTDNLENRVEKAEYFDNGQISSSKIFSDGKLIRQRHWSLEGIQTYETDYVYSQNDDTYEEISYTTQPLREHITERIKYRGLPEGTHTPLRKWIYDKETYRLLRSGHYREGTEIIDKLDTYNKQEELERTYVYHYMKGKEKLKRVIGFDVYNAEGNKTRSYNENTTLNIEEILLNRDADQEQIEEWLRIYRNDKRIPVVVLDSGFDINHPLITHKLWKNPKEKPNGIDDDGNGWVDDIMGWHKRKDKKFGIDIDSPNIKEPVILDSFTRNIPRSHGTHMASIALRDLEDFALVGFAGDVTNPEYLNRISQFIKDHKILFVNMSFGFGGKGDITAPPPDTFMALEKLIEENPETLFFASAGNKRRDLDSPYFKNYPASFPFENLLVSGSINTDEIKESELPNYKIAKKFSNIGKKTVDIFAPGIKIPGALIGGGIERTKSGTSLSAPYSLNSALKIYKENPNLTALEIKEIILKTAYVKDTQNPLPAVSGGILYPQRALKVARLLADNPTLSIEEAVSKICDSEHHKVPD